MRELDRLTGRYRGGVVWSIETGGGENSEVSTIASIAAVLGTTVAYLVDGIGPEPTVESVTAAVEKARNAKEAS